ncbi:MAG: phenylalanine--tRNA ligase beta subunit-related protein, partial [Patescibacteria group bacterium]
QKKHLQKKFNLFPKIKNGPSGSFFCGKILFMKLAVSKEIFEKFPNVTIGVVVAEGVDNEAKKPEILKMVHGTQKKVKSDFEGKPIFEDPTIGAWRKVYKDFGAKKYRTSIEALVKRSINDDLLGSINNLVDLYNYISLKYILPLGGEDLDKVEGDIVLALADGTERFIPIFSEEVEHPKPGEVVYKDDQDVMCRRWNWREAEKTKLTEDTTNAVFVTEGTLSEERGRVEEATKELAELIEKYCGGKMSVFFLDNKNTEVNFE